MPKGVATVFFCAALSTISSSAFADGAGACRGLTREACEALVEATWTKSPQTPVDEADLIYHSACRNGVAAGCVLYGRSPGAEMAEIDLQPKENAVTVKSECDKGSRFSCAVLERQKMLASQPPAPPPPNEGERAPAEK